VPHRFKTILWATALPLLVCAGALSAQPPATDASQESAKDSKDPEDPEDDNPLVLRDEIVVTANRLPSPAETVGSSVTVIGREEIERRGATPVLDLLRTVPGLDVSQSGGPGTVASVFIRGGNSNHTLVLIDGVRVTSNSGGFDFSGLRADNLERIEVLRGPQSTLYGSEAIGGVVSIITRRGRDGFHFELDGRAGSLDTRDVRLQADGGTDRFDYSLSVADRRTDGLSAASERRGNTEKDPASDQTVSGRFGLALKADGRLDLVLRHVDADSSLDGFTLGVGPTDDPNFTQQRRLSVASLQLFQPVLDGWNLRVNASAERERSRLRDPDTSFNNAAIESRLGALSAQSELGLGAADTLIVGVSKERRQGENAGGYDEELDVDSAYLENNWAWRQRLYLTAGARHDRYSRFGDKTTWRVTGTYLWPGDAWKLHGSYGTGFRGPSFDELFFPFAGNLGLRPESSEGYDAGVERSFRGGAVVAGVTWFQNRFKDLIGFDFTTSTFGNVRRAESRGVEASLRVRPRADLEIEASYTQDDTEDLATGLALARRPRHRLALVTAFEPWERLRGTASLVAVDDRIDSDGTKMDDYERVDLSLDYRLREWVEPYLLVQNLFGESYEEVAGYTSPGFQALVGLRLRYR
jgi:vitamin B12 transporter